MWFVYTWNRRNVNVVCKYIQQTKRQCGLYIHTTEETSMWFVYTYNRGNVNAICIRTSSRRYDDLNTEEAGWGGALVNFEKPNQRRVQLG